MTSATIAFRISDPTFYQRRDFIQGDGVHGTIGESRECEIIHPSLWLGKEFLVRSNVARTVIKETDRFHVLTGGAGRGN